MRQVDRFALAAYEIIGGLLSGAFLLDDRASILVHPVGYALLSLCGASVVCGVLLWMDRDAGYYWSKALQALQIPHVVATGAAYRLVICWDITLGVRDGGWFGVWGSMQTSLALTFHVHERPLDIGVNLMAIWCFGHLIYLERRNREAKRPKSDAFAHVPPSAA